MGSAPVTVSTQDDALDDRHLLLFGGIVHCFARHEALLLEASASLSGASVTAMKLVTARLGYTGVRDGLLDLMRHGGMPVPELDALLRLLAIPNTYVGLFTDIARSTWVKAEAANTIRPAWLSHGTTQAVKPLHIMDDTGGRLREGPEDTATYTLEQLREILEILRKNYGELRAALAEKSMVTG